MRRLLTTLLLTTVGAAVFGVALLPAPASADPAPSRPRTAAEKGLNYRDLVVDQTGARCGWAFELVNSDARPRCTHGPDAAPEGVDVSRRWSPSLAADTTPAAASPSLAAATSGVQCYADGQSGNRVQAIYAHSGGSRWSTVAPSIRQWAAQVESVFNNSAGETGGQRHVRFVTDSSCNVTVLDVQLSANGDASMSNTVNELQAQGFTRADRKYLVWVDANVYCGIAQVYNDDSVAATNLSNGNPNVSGEIARVDNGCWGLGNQGQSIEAHELMHTMGGVQTSAPHATQYSHCWDESDRMCYADGSPSGTMQQICPTSHENLFDCNHDDYFSTSPAAGTYLATHWNVANSSFLASNNGTGVTTTTTAPPTTTTTKPPSTTTTTKPPSTTTTTNPPSTTTTTRPPSTTTTTQPPTSNPTPTSASKPAIVRSGEWYLRQTLSSGGADMAFGFGNASDVPLLCDWNGDGVRTPGVYRNGWFYLTNTAGSGATASAAFGFGDPGDAPVCGDWDGNGTDTVGVVRAGMWYLRNSNSSGPADLAFGFGNAGDWPAVGDWDGNGADGVGVVRAGAWYLRNTASGGGADASFGYGNATDSPLTGDWNGDGVDSPGVFRAGTWYVRNSVVTGGADATFGYGDSNDTARVWR